MSARDRSSNRRYFSPVVLRLAELRWDTKSIPVEGHRVRTSTTAGVREIGSQFGRNEILHGRGFLRGTHNSVNIELNRGRRSLNLRDILCIQ